MKVIKRNPILNIANSFIVDSPLPSNISYLWNYGSLLGLCLVIQIITGVILAMNYIPNIKLAFVSVEHIMRDLNYGYLIRYSHANGASLFFMCLYLHMARGLYYNSYTQLNLKSTWRIGVIIFVMTMATAFLGYCLPYGQLSFWGQAVITNLLSVIPYVGTNIVIWVWGSFSVDNPTLNRFFSLHYLLPFLVVALVIVHLITLHNGVGSTTCNGKNSKYSSGSNNPLGISSYIDRLKFHPYYSYKDLVGFVVMLMLLLVLVFYNPNLLGEVDNYTPANPLVTPTAITPETYLLPFYGILRAIPHKLGGVVVMLCSILVLLFLPNLETSLIRGLTFRPIMKIFYWFFIVNFIILGYLGSQHAEDPYILISRIATIYYLAYFIIITPLVGHLENLLLLYPNNNKPNNA